MLALVGFIGLCLLVGLVGGSMTEHALPHWYRFLRAPPGTPPDWVFAPVWLVLYVLMGVAGWLVWKRIGAGTTLRLWGWQLAANALWAPAFFGLHNMALALAMLAVLVPLIGLTVGRFHRINRMAAALLAPSLAWSLFTIYLNVGFLILNAR